MNKRIMLFLISSFAAAPLALADPPPSCGASDAINQKLEEIKNESEHAQDKCSNNIGAGIDKEAAAGGQAHSDYVSACVGTYAEM
jgi:hypothetical protein